MAPTPNRVGTWDWEQIGPHGDTFYGTWTDDAGQRWHAARAIRHGDSWTALVASERVATGLATAEDAQRVAEAHHEAVLIAELDAGG